MELRYRCTRGCSAYEGLLSCHTWIQGDQGREGRIQKYACRIDDGLNDSVGVRDIEVGSTYLHLGAKGLPIKAKLLRASGLRFQRRVASRRYHCIRCSSAGSLNRKIEQHIVVGVFLIQVRRMKRFVPGSTQSQ